MHLHIFCEDFYGKQILPKFLAPFTKKFNSVQAVTYRGVDNLIQDVTDDASFTLKQDSTAYVFILVDVKGFPEGYFPKEIYRTETPNQAKYQWIVQHFYKAVDHALKPRCFVHPTMMELETWILADIQGLAPYLRVKNEKLKRLHAPESDDDPTKTLQTLTRSVNPPKFYTKASSALVFNYINAQNVYDDNCPSFVRLVDDLLKIQGLKPVVAYQPSGNLPPDDDPECKRLREEMEARLEALTDDDGELEALIRLDAEYKARC